MVNVHNVIHWFRYASSDNRLDVLCRLLDCCMPLELQFLHTYLNDLLRRNMVLNQHCETTTASLCSNLRDLREITGSTNRRQLCLLLTRLKSESCLPAYNIYDILIQYDFAKFFSRVLSMDEELVDELLLLFTLAANHPAMNFSQRSRLHQRLSGLRDAIEKSFKCYETETCSQVDQHYLCHSTENITTTVTKDESPELLRESSTTRLDSFLTTAEQDEVKNNRENLEVHIKDLRVLKVQQRSFDKKYEYVFEVTWSNGKVIKVHRAYGELFDFQCKLRRCHSKDGCKVPGKRLIPYLPPRKPIKFCKGTDILPDISNYVREFAQLPDKILHSERVEHFFSDGNEKASETSSQHQIPKSKLNPNQEQKETPPSRPATETARVNEEIKPDKGTGLPKKHSPKDKSSSTIFCKKPTSSLQTALKLGAKKLDVIGQKNNGPETMTSSKGGVKGKTVNHPLEVKISRHLQEEKAGNHPGVNRSPKVVTAEHSSEGPATNKVPETRNHLSPAAAEEVKAVNHSPTVATLNQQPQVVISSSRPEGKTIDHSPQVKLTNHSTEVKITKNARNVNLKSSSSSSHSIQSPTKKSRVFKNHRKENLFVTNGDIRRTDDVNTSVSVTTHPPKDSVAMNGHTHRPYLGKMPPNQGDHTELDETCAVTLQVTSEMKSRTPLTVAVPVPSPVCSKCLTFSPFLSDSSPTSSLSTSPLDSPLSLGPSQPLALSLSPDQRHFNSVMTKCTPERIKLCQRQKHERFKDSSDEESLNHCSTNINKIEAKETEKEKLKASSSSLKSAANPTRNGFNLGHSVRPNTSQRGLLIVPNGYSQYSLNQDGPDQQEYSVPSSYNELTCYDCHTNFDTRTNSLDSNCNYIIHNGNHPNTSDLKSNKTHENKHKVYLNDKSNGFSRPFCYNCGERGHAGHECVETQFEDYSLS